MRSFAHGWAEPFEWPPAMGDVAVDMALDVLPDVSPGGTPGGTELVATPASRESIDGAAPVRTPLGELQMQQMPGAATPAELRQLRNEQQAAPRRAAGPGSRQQESEQLQASSTPLSSWAARSQESRSAHYESQRRRRASDPFAERARRQREYERERSTQAGIERHRASARATRTRQQDEDAARATGLTQLYSDADRLLEYQHRCSGAPISANSRRVAALKEAGQDLNDEYEEAVQDTLDDIERYAHVSILEAAQCVWAFQECDDRFGDMQVCAACGVRDPEMDYTCLLLDNLSEGHWMSVNERALARLDAAPPFELLRRRPEGEAAWPRVQIQRRDFHNLYVHDGRTLHCVPEAVGHDRGDNAFINLCSCCTRKRQVCRSLVEHTPNETR
jgi:hypothetical protein